MCIRDRSYANIYLQTKGGATRSRSGRDRAYTCLSVYIFASLLSSLTGCMYLPRQWRNAPIRCELDNCNFMTLLIWLENAYSRHFLGSSLGIMGRDGLMLTQWTRLTFRVFCLSATFRENWPRNETLKSEDRRADARGTLSLSASMLCYSYGTDNTDDTKWQENIPSLQTSSAPMPRDKMPLQSKIILSYHCGLLEAVRLKMQRMESAGNEQRQNS